LPLVSRFEIIFAINKRDMTDSEPATPTATAGSKTPPSPVILQLSIKQFRGIKELTWRPGTGVNVILGGGDVGKTTILDAIGLLLSPTNSVALSDTDYYRRDIEAGFEIEAIMTLPLDGGIHERGKPSWPWEWNGSDAVVPNVEAEDTLRSEPVYKLRVRATENLELAFELVQPDGDADHFSVTLRRSIGLVRLGGDDRSDRDLRLVQGSALDRLLSDKALRSRMASQLSKTNVHDQLLEEGQKALAALDIAFTARSLPRGLDISITGGPGASIASLIGLTANRDGVPLPLANWGAGTRRLSALTIAGQNQGDHPITLVDEIERGLEPYRQRMLVGKLQSMKSQAFITTHSPAAISAAADASLWYVDHSGRIGLLDKAKTARHRAKEPDTFLARIAVIGEGATEVGFVSDLLERATGCSLQQHGIHVCDGGGHDSTVHLLEALAEAGLRFGGFADNEGNHSGRWEKIANNHGKLLCRWQSGCIEFNIINAVPDDRLEALLIDPRGKNTGARLRSLADRMGIAEKDFTSISDKAGAGLRTLMIEAATGTVPADKPDEASHYKSHAQSWFKTEHGGRELASKAMNLGAWPALRTHLLPFCNAIRGAVDLPELLDLPP
jgi:putative ATP-dependent endonuclease of OLD family